MNNTTSKQPAKELIKLLQNHSRLALNSYYGTKNRVELLSTIDRAISLAQELHTLQQKYGNLPHGLKVTQYGFDDYNHPTINRVDTDKYAIRFMKMRYTRSGYWIHEPQPSSRTKMFFSRTQMSLQEAFDQYPKAISSLTNTIVSLMG